MRSWRRLIFGTDRLIGDESEPDRFLSLIEVRTAMRICLLTSGAILLLWALEMSSGIVAPHDQYGLPAMSATMLALFLRLRRHPESLLACQRVAVVMIMSYFAMCGVTAVTHQAGQLSPYWTANNLQWLPVVTLLLHFSYPWGVAVRLSLVMLAVAAMPAVWLGWYAQETAWADLTRSLLINALLMQVTFTLCLLVVTRFTSGVRDIVAGAAQHTDDIRQALDRWVTQRTTELAHAKDEAEAASQAKSRFLAVMSHELRTPLHAMLAASELLSDGHPTPPERQRALLAALRSSGDHLLALIDQVLEMSRIEAGKVEPVEQALDLTRLTQTASDAVRSRAELKGLTLQVSWAEPLPRARLGDELRLTQVLINLLANAVKFTDRGGVTLRVEAAPDGPDGVPWVSWLVQDTGTGMTQAEQAQVFEPFFQADGGSTRGHGGVGLGLTITRELVQLMRGRVRMESQPGHGTRIEVSVPMPLACNAIDPQPPLPRQVPQLQGISALVVDDEPVNRMLAVEMLASAGVEVLEAEDGLQAIEALRQHTPDIVLMDWQMPGMDGLSTTQRIRQGEAGEAARDVPILGLTANAFDGDRHSCLAAGMNDVLTKPVSREQLLHEVDFWVTEPNERARRA